MKIKYSFATEETTIVGGDMVRVKQPKDEDESGVHGVLWVHPQFHPPVALANGRLYNMDELEKVVQVPKMGKRRK
jgi:hypothetical protein